MPFMIKKSDLDQSNRGVPTPAAYLRWSGIWDMQDLYESMVDYFRRRKYKFQEKVYKHKHPSPYGTERQYSWEAVRKESEYTLVTYNIYMHTYDAHDIEVVMADGNNKTFTKGRLWVEFKVLVTYDYEKRFESKQFYAHLRDFYNKYVLRKRFTQGWSPKFRTELYELHALVKNRLKMEYDQFEHRNIIGVHKRMV